MAYLRVFKPALAAVLTLSAVIASAASPTTPFEAHFKVKKSSLPLGDASFQLARANQPDCYTYSGQAHPNAFVHVFLGDIREKSRFCVVDGHVQPRFFQHHIDGKPKKSYTLTFDRSTGVVRYTDEAGHKKTYPLKSGAQDPLSLQIAARLWVAGAGNPNARKPHDFLLADDDGIETYRVAVSDSGNINVPAGRYDTLKLARVGDHADGLTFWLAKNAAWIPVQVKKIDDGDTRYHMQMVSLKLGR